MINEDEAAYSARFRAIHAPCRDADMLDRALDYTASDILVELVEYELAKAMGEIH